ncbi:MULTISPECIES: HTH-type transcriptional activator IlvY [Cobetia]|uniref:HTH-type transcriptional activator IlvY n=1 Tax=Cobetia crustatorum TaxID=553385 RepID=A0A558HEW7_9GAMM|nr:MULTISPECIES: HTH-type transcriptional activator IlvY [Cobetia]TVU67627.1 HTH-type transcriptional activator IlvY [Cobetia crustatorum]
MDNRQLKQFLTLAETLHFGRASTACHLSASALSRAIRAMEEDLGVTLFERDNRSVALTPAGERFRRHARELLNQWDDIRQSLLEDSNELRGELSLYCSVTASYSFLYDILAAFRARHPHVELKLHTGDPAVALERVLMGHEDLAIAARPDVLPARLAFTDFAESPLRFIAPRRDGPGQQLEGIDETGADETSIDWARVPMILSETGLARERFDVWCHTRGIKPRLYAQVAGNEAIVSMVGLGFGIGVVPQIVLDNSPLADQVRILEVDPPLTPYKVGLCVQEKRLRHPLVRALWDELPNSPLRTTD